MNAFEIIKNIIPDGIAQCQKSIWDRLLIPDFSEPEPEDYIASFTSPEAWLDYELQRFAAANQQFEIEYYASKSLMNEDEFRNINFSYSFKRDYAPDYYEYKKKWQVDHHKLIEIEKSRQEIQSLFDGEFLEKKDFIALKLSDITKSRITPYLNPHCS